MLRYFTLSTVLWNKTRKEKSRKRGKNVLTYNLLIRCRYVKGRSIKPLKQFDGLRIIFQRFTQPYFLVICTG